VTREEFFEKFELFAELPDAVAKMRELILQLAVRGRLVSQLDNDGTAEELIKTIEDERTQLFRIEEYQPAESPLSHIPENWRWVPTAILCTLETGKRMSGGAQAEGVISLGGEHLKPNGSVDYTVPRYISVDFYEKMRTGRVQLHDTLMVKDGATTGKTVFVKALPPDGRAAVNEHVFILRWHPPVHKRLAYYFLRAFSAIHIATKSAGLIGGIRREAVLDFPLPLPPAEEQKRIVEKVDELLALCDQLEAQQNERETRHAALARASLSRFAVAPCLENLSLLLHSYMSPNDVRRAVLGLAVEGKIVPRDPNDEPITMTVGDVNPIDGREDGGRHLPSHWRLFTYRSLTTLITSGSRGWKSYYAKSGAIFLRTQNIKTDELILDDVAFVALPASVEGVRAKVLKNDILITITGANVTKAARVEFEIPEAYVSQHIALSRPRYPLMSPWLHLCFTSHAAGRGTLEQLAYGDKPGLNLDNIRELVLPIPPVPEQHRIVEQVDRLMARIDEFEAQLSASRAVGGKLIDAVVREMVR